ncbi:MAG: class I SAM-dependent methyltransferase [Pseudonocardiales bacterium]|nr:class I SAM-dependent methyltransferase [Pseudonocardiales bacterium]
MSDEAGARQYHFDPATYLAMMLAEVPAYRDLQHHVAEAVKGISADSILELGVGTGETSAVVLAVHPDTRLVGIDESQPMLALGRCRFPGADLRVQRLEDPLPAGTYNLIFSALTVHHLDGTGKADLFRRVHSRLRRHGRFVLADVVVPDDPEDAVTPVGPPHDKPSTLTDQLSWLQQAGLQPAVCWQQQDLVVITADRVTA